jgi:hypothetical protein
MGIGQEIYDSTASFGRIWALLSAILGTIFGLVMVIAGIYFLVKKPDRYAVDGKVLKINGNEKGVCPLAGNMYNCNMTIQYTYKDELYNTDIYYNAPRQYNVGDTISVYVLTSNPKDIVVGEPVPRWFGGLLLVFGLIFIAAGWFWYWASRKWKPVAAAEGVGGMYRIINTGSGVMFP